MVYLPGVAPADFQRLGRYTYQENHKQHLILVQQGESQIEPNPKVFMQML
ncbi:hypothetical protein HPP92_028265 [Vanilla planifolia]|uniref:Uncharacterized protein n=1 Tax=Vanilla planifolia TaxID=51239 RepID=A0A835P8Q7_VANPL|nr:hypothetical protein HPP92_028265 [Vanilla planifolia]